MIEGELPSGVRMGTPRVAMDDRTRRRLGLEHWPDGTIGFGDRRRRIDCLAANGRTSARVVARERRDVLEWDVTERDIEIASSRTGADYAAGGPFLSIGDGLDVVVYHGEFHHGDDHTSYWSFLGLALDDGTGHPVDLGPIVSPGIAHMDPVLRGHSVDVTGGAFIIRNGFLYVYFVDVRRSHGVIGLGVARASLRDVISRARRGEAARFWKLCDGEFASPGLGGEADDLLESRHHPILWFDAAWWADIGAFVLVYSTKVNPKGPGPRRWALMFTTSSDGVTWEEPVDLLGESRRELIYVSLRSDPATRRVEGPLDMWWLSSADADFERWSDAALMRCRLWAGDGDAPA